jgi:peptidoglycan/LPS O-acetylase OafA/YrhL
MTAARHAAPRAADRNRATGAGEIRSLTGLRIVAAAWVVLFHFSFTPGDSYAGVEDALAPILRTGALGVDLFYILSGFVITLTYLGKSGPRASARGSVAFWWARICRVWPVYAVVTTLFGGWLLYKGSRVTDGFVAYQAVQPVVDLWQYAQQLLMVQLWGQSSFDGSSWVGAAWSISAEWLAYVCFPLVVLLLWRLRNASAVVTGGLAVAAMLPFALVCVTTGNPYFPWSWALRIGAGFLAGALTCLAVRRIAGTPRVERMATVLGPLAVAGILAGLWWGEWRGQGSGEYGGVVVLLFPVLVGSLALSPRGLGRVLASRPMVHGGRISYTLYLVHVPVFEIFWTYMGWTPALAPDGRLAPVLVPAVLVGTFLLAHLGYRYLEEPARLFLRHRGPGRWAAVQPPARTAAVQPPARTATAAVLPQRAAAVPGPAVAADLPGSVGARA